MHAMHVKSSITVELIVWIEAYAAFFTSLVITLFNLMCVVTPVFLVQFRRICLHVHTMIGMYMNFFIIIIFHIIFGTPWRVKLPPKS